MIRSDSLRLHSPLQAEELKQAIANYYAAKTTLDTKGSQNTPEGMEARKAMETRQDMAEKTRNILINDILNETAIYLAGGDEVKGSILLEDKVQDAATSCLDRLFPQFHQADTPDGTKSIERGKKGDGDALGAIGHKGDPDTHAVCKAVRDFVGSGKRGTDIRKKFAAPPYGWPQDAIDAALFVLFKWAPPGPERHRGSPQGQARSEEHPVDRVPGRVDHADESPTDRAACPVQGHRAEHPDELRVGGRPQVPGSDDQAGRTGGGDTPQPKRPSTTHLEDLSNRVGNDQLKAIYDLKDTLTHEISDWQKRKRRSSSVSLAGPLFRPF